MSAKIVRKEGKRLTIEITVDLKDSMLDSEEAIQTGVNEAGALASEEALKQFDTNGAAIEMEGKVWRSKGQEEKCFQTPYGEITVARHVYQYQGRGQTVCPLEQDARIIGTATPRFAKQVSAKMANNSARVVQADLFGCQQRTVSVSFLQHLTSTVALIAAQKEPLWHYELPVFKYRILTIALSLDGTCMHLSGDGWREAMTGTISFYDTRGERQHTIYLGATPEYGKDSFLQRFSREIEGVKARYPDAAYVGVADGAETNWRFLNRYTDTHILDFFHAVGYLGAVAQVLFPNAEKAQNAWLEDRCHRLKHESGAAESLYQEMLKVQQDHTGLPTHRQEKLDATVTYYNNHRHQMDYANYASRLYPIGSGVVEAACKTLIKQRFCLAGMRWKQPGAAAILNLRALSLTAQRWVQFWQKIDLLGFQCSPAFSN